MIGGFIRRGSYDLKRNYTDSGARHSVRLCRVLTAKPGEDRINQPTGESLESLRAAVADRYSSRLIAHIEMNHKPEDWRGMAEL